MLGVSVGAFRFLAGVLGALCGVQASLRTPPELISLLQMPSCNRALLLWGPVGGEHGEGASYSLGAKSPCCRDLCSGAWVTPTVRQEGRRDLESGKSGAVT